MSNGQIKSIVERIQRLTEERKAIADDIAEVYAEAKSNGLDKAAIKWVVSELEKPSNERQERDTIRDLYMQAVVGGGLVHVHTRAREANLNTPAGNLPPERDPQSGSNGSDDDPGGVGEGPVYMTPSEQDSTEQSQTRNQPGSDVAASGGGGRNASPETPRRAVPYDAGPIPAFLDRRTNAQASA